MEIEDLVDHPLQESKKPIWAIISLVSGVLGIFVMAFFIYTMLPLVGLVLRAGDELAQSSDIDLGLLKLGIIGVVSGILYLISLWSLIVSYIKESMTVARVTSSVGHLLSLITLAFIFLSRLL